MTSSELVGDAERAVADRRSGDDVQRGLRLVPALLPVARDDVERPVHAQPRRPRQLPAERQLDQVPPARVQRPAGLAPGRRLLQRPHRQVHERLRDPGRHPSRPAGVGRVVREGLRGRPLLRLQPDREDRRRPRLRTSPSTATSRTTTRPMSSAIAPSTSSRTARSRDEPFWLNLWFNSPHGPFDPAPRDLYRLAGTPLPKLPAFNEKDISDKPKWFRQQVKQAASARSRRR